MQKKKYNDRIDHTTETYEHDFGSDFEVRYTEEIPAIPPNWEEEESFSREEPDDVRYTQNMPRPSELADPLQNIVHTGSSLAGTLMRFLFRPAPFLMSGVILLITAAAYWADSARYGELLSVVQNPDPSLVSFLAIGAVVLLWELCCFFFTIAGVWSGNGRGLSFFVLVYLLSYVSGLAGSFLPQEIPFINGIRGGLITYGSLYSMIFPFCIIGILSCILQKIFRR